MTRPPLSKTAKTSDAAAKAAPAGAVPDSARQMAAFEQAMKLFHARKLKEARDLFQQAAAGPERDVAQRANLHVAMCDRRLQHAIVSLGSAEDYYNYGIALINSRNLPEARAHLEKGVQISPGSDHIHYALAVAQALSGDLNAAHESLRRAIEIDPRNRIAARQDGDLAPFVNQSLFSGLLFPERK
ncbi:MAG TPA: tetratricopeptide repeat protein [Candidatus Acidoferrales bacterium]|nr:tetratricopeptide repeat protein [Candidatus Acidoferrales bacterium]